MENEEVRKKIIEGNNFHEIRQNTPLVPEK
jgi:hypothetical protein